MCNKDKEVDFVASKADRVIYVQCAYLLAEPETIVREYTSLEAISDNYEKDIVTLDDLIFPSNKGIRHIQAWNFRSLLVPIGRNRNHLIFIKIQPISFTNFVLNFRGLF